MCRRKRGGNEERQGAGGGGGGLKCRREKRTIHRYPRARSLPSTESEGDNIIFGTFPVSQISLTVQKLHRHSPLYLPTFPQLIWIQKQKNLYLMFRYGKKNQVISRGFASPLGDEYILGQNQWGDRSRSKRTIPFLCSKARQDCYM